MASTDPLVSSSLQGDGVKQWLGIKYAALQQKFAEAQICEYTDIENFEHFNHGLSAISPPNACEFEFGLIQKSLPATKFPQSDTECLNLNITAPADALRGPSALPVFVFIHGGGYSIGSNAWPQYDQARIVTLSQELGIPVIGVGINYRLGPFGFLTSKELQAHGYSANNGLKDQQVALIWIKKHIALFGGDPNRITCMGESAGAVSTMHQIQLGAGTPSFSQLISFSGSPLMMRPLPSFVADDIYQTVTAILGLQKLSAAERVAALSSMPATELLMKLPPGLPFLPVLDERTIKKETSFAELASDTKTQLPENINMLIGSCDMDASIFGVMFASKQAGCLKRFIEILNEFALQHTSEILRAYHITPEMNDSEAWPLILHFANDISFHAPASAYASAWKSTAYQYRFREPNPWEGPWKGYATHVLDTAYLFLNYTENLSKSQAKLAVEFATDVIHFINGKAPFQKVEQGSKFVKEYISEDGITSSRDKQGNDTVWPSLFSRAGYDAMSGVWAKFLSS
ncbi:Para-nitrobenzyl esterase [Lachnellula occidentalis]|uniref:Para-nitrobenzyl esterase n=1 Tax=Lachnellula occidentalis TaxID=215460 RepID=A0A8H8S9H6_9HELO|nr:Para-nitrobenzyl esterase [Lachnellula occidentalis]